MAAKEDQQHSISSIGAAYLQRDSLLTLTTLGQAALTNMESSS